MHLTLIYKDFRVVANETRFRQTIIISTKRTQIVKAMFNRKEAIRCNSRLIIIKAIIPSIDNNNNNHSEATRFKLISKDVEEVSSVAIKTKAEINLTKVNLNYNITQKTRHSKFRQGDRWWQRTWVHLRFSRHSTPRITTHQWACTVCIKPKLGAFHNLQLTLASNTLIFMQIRNMISTIKCTISTCNFKEITQTIKYTSAQEAEVEHSLLL